MTTNTTPTSGDKMITVTYATADGTTVSEVRPAIGAFALGRTARANAFADVLAQAAVTASRLRSRDRCYGIQH